MKKTYSPEVCFVGLGPAGIGGAYILSQSHLARRTLSIDAGVSLDDRCCHILEGNRCIRENPCQMISGVGGCSAISGQKLSGYPAGSGLASILGSEALAKAKLAECLQILKNFFALDEPKIPQNQTSAREEYEKLGFKYRFYPVYAFNHMQLAKAYRAFLQK